MQPFWIDTGTDLRLAIVPRPRGRDWLEDELRAIRRAGIDVLVSMLTSEEMDELGLAKEAEFCTLEGISFRWFPVADREVPVSHADFAAFLTELQDDLRAGKSVAVHCRASIGRASLLLASLLSAEGLSPTDAFARITAARGLQVPDTPEQVRWVEGLAPYLNASR